METEMMQLGPTSSFAPGSPTANQAFDATLSFDDLVGDADRCDSTPFTRHITTLQLHVQCPTLHLLSVPIHSTHPPPHPTLRFPSSFSNPENTEKTGVELEQI